MRAKCYSELIRLESFIDRFNYLKCKSKIGYETFGYDRYINQEFYTSNEWKKVKKYVVTRDLGCDLGHRDHRIPKGIAIYTHHIIPVTVEDFLNGSDLLLDPENLITTTFDTHQAIHYGDSDLIVDAPIIRKPNDMCPWLL